MLKCYTLLNLIKLLTSFTIISFYMTIRTLQEQNRIYFYFSKILGSVNRLLLLRPNSGRIQKINRGVKFF